MNLRDDIEHALRSWNAHETERGAPPVVDFDCHPTDAPPAPRGRLQTRRELVELLARATSEDRPGLAGRLRASLAYLDALLGERLPIAEYIEVTQGCGAVGWPADYVSAVGERAQEHLADIGVPWDSSLYDALDSVEEPLEPADAPDVIRAASHDYEAAVRALVDSTAQFDLTIEQVDVEAYWAYWLDGSGSRVRMRINRKRATFSLVQARQFALHEILGHGLQCASFSQACSEREVPWIRLTAVHAQQQVLLEGLAQALPLFITPDDPRLVARVRAAHYLELVRSELHLAINSGLGVAECAALARKRVPFWSDELIASLLTDRGSDPLLRSYLWAYPAGIDWFVNLADNASTDTISAILRSAYREPLSPAGLVALWPAGPQIGGHLTTPAGTPAIR